MLLKSLKERNLVSMMCLQTPPEAQEIIGGRDAGTLYLMSSGNPLWTTSAHTGGKDSIDYWASKTLLQLTSSLFRKMQWPAGFDMKNMYDVDIGVPVTQIRNN